MRLHAMLFAFALLAASGCATAPMHPEAPAVTQLVFVVAYKPGPAWRAGVPMNRQALAPHAGYWTRLAHEGRAIGAGAFLDVDGGMALIVAAGMDDARAVVAADPAVTSGVFVAELHQWSPRIRGAGDLPR